jgi:hypothetical protein
MLKNLTLLASFATAVGSISAFASCPDLSGVYEADYTIMNQPFHVVSTVTQQGCESMKAVNSILGPHGRQGYTREWIADGVFRRKDTSSVENAVFTSEGLVTTEVRSPVEGDTVPAPPYFSRRDVVSLDENKNMVNAEEQFDEQGNRIGTDRFVYQRKQLQQK